MKEGRFTGIWGRCGISAEKFKNLYREVQKDKLRSVEHIYREEFKKYTEKFSNKYG
tara:strand:+ start:189 stop:356 length:168 start_codon:yes stop_codon:yes gene_type:complete